jgi:hypothetical protein
MLLAWSLVVLPADAVVFNEENGLVVAEAEHYAAVADEQWPWINGTEYGGFAGTGYMQDSNPNDIPNRGWGETKGVTYTINLNGGTYHVWLLRWIPGNATPGSWGNSAGGRRSNSVHIGLDRTEIGAMFDNENVNYEQWYWQGPATVEAGEGLHTFHIRAREGGYSVDRFLLTTDLNFVPTVTGSATLSDLRESAQRQAQIEAARKADLATLQAANPGWPMYKIDTRLWNHNSLSPGDVNRDGHTDWAVIHEGPNKYTFLLHPGAGGDVTAEWQKVIIGGGKNPEYSDFGDFDGDGNLDIVGVGGEGAGLKIFWGPEPSRVSDPSAWTDGGLMGATRNRGHFLYVQSHDINKDGATDIMVGGRAQGGHGLQSLEGKRTAGIIWIEAPADPKERRNPSKWIIHDIDSKTKGGHGFVFDDIDQDGDEDIINCNADWNTAESEETILWYENPGVGSAKQKVPWPAHLIYQGSEVYSKGQLAVGDLNKDGLTDFCVQTEKSVFYFRKTGLNPVTWERIVIPKPAMAQWLARPTKLADINGDGRLDIIGMLIHDEKGNLPADKASVFWMEYTGDEPKADNWVTHVIKWSDGANTGRFGQGEKWDHCRLMDMDGDGDVDIVGNCEEHYRREGSERATIIGVVWFENRL